MGQTLDGRVALVTGATNGIGQVTAREFARMGARTLIVARDPGRGEAVAREIRDATGATVEVLVADLSSREEVARLAGEVRERTGRLDLLVNNAGAIFAERRVSADGVEMTLALNHLAYFLLTLELLPLLEAAPEARVVNVSSMAHERGAIDFEDLQGERRYGMWKSYAQSKLANVLFTRELSRRLRGSPDHGQRAPSRGRRQRVRPQPPGLLRQAGRDRRPVPRLAREGRQDHPARGDRARRSAASPASTSPPAGRRFPPGRRATTTPRSACGRSPKR